MHIYSESIVAFTNRLRSAARDILFREANIPFHGWHLDIRSQYWPLKIICFEDQDPSGKIKDLGCFSWKYLYIGINRCLMYKSGESFILNVLRHELAHYLTYIHHGKDVSPHGVEYRRICANIGWGRDVFKAKANQKEWESSLQENIKEKRIIEKIQKLFALGDSNNAFEAEAATIKANELLIKYNLQKDSVFPNDHEEYCTCIVMTSKRADATMHALADVLKNFLVQPIYCRGEEGSYLEVVGTRLNVLMADYVANFLIHEFERLWKNAKQTNPTLKGLASKNSFLAGVAKGLNQKLASSKERSATKNQLIVLKNSLDRATQLVYPQLRKKNVKASRYCKEGALAGEVAGKNISIKPGISQNNGTPKIIEYQG